MPSVFIHASLKPISEYVSVVHRASVLLSTFVEAVFQLDWQKAALIKAEIAKKELAVRHLKAKMCGQFSADPSCSLEWSGQLSYLSKQNKIIHQVIDIVWRIFEHSLVFPQGIQTDFKQLLDGAVATVGLTSKATKAFDHLLDSDFDRQGVILVEDAIAAIGYMGNDLERSRQQLHESMLAIEKSLEPVAVSIFYRLFDSVVELANSAEIAGSQLGVMLDQTAETIFRGPFYHEWSQLRYS